MGTDARHLRLKCVLCDAVSERLVAASELRLNMRGEFIPIRCEVCGDKAAVPTVREWELSANDRTLLGRMRITAA